jgi:hypothetical protein
LILTTDAVELLSQYQSASHIQYTSDSEFDREPSSESDDDPGQHVNIFNSTVPAGTSDTIGPNTEDGTLSMDDTNDTEILLVNLADSEKCKSEHLTLN